jgi:hypothetical protein
MLQEGILIIMLEDFELPEVNMTLREAMLYVAFASAGERDDDLSPNYLW